jgi:prepilin-type N-terminal cleavage/methylation domain-containing protein
MRKGVTLVELLMVLAVLTAFSAAVTGVLHTLIGEIPRAQRMIAEKSTVLEVLDYMQQDMDAALSLPESRWPYHSEPNTIIIERVEGMVVYLVKEDGVMRKELFSNEYNDEPREISWSLDKAKIRGRLLRENQRAYAVEVHAWIEQEVGGRTRRKLENSHIFYLGAASISGEKL